MRSSIESTGTCVRLDRGGRTVLPIQKILHPTDFSDRSGPAFELACSLARDYGAELVVLHVAQPPLLLPMEGVLVPTPVDEVEASREQLEKIHAADPRVKLIHRLAEGNPPDEILTAASGLPADLIVIGSHGRSGLSRVLIGSVAEVVMRKAPCPVLTVKAPCHLMCQSKKKDNSTSCNRVDDAQAAPSKSKRTTCSVGGDCR
jgi:nucleotide-binding universal stress UspA family protein